MNKIYKCQYCGKEFDSKQKLGGHVSRCKYNLNRKQNKKQERFLYKVKCLKCGKIFELELTTQQFNNGKHKKYCSRSCANSHIHTDETKQKISKSLCKYDTISKHENNIIHKKESKCIQKTCKVCNKLYIHDKKMFPGSTESVCSDDCKLYMRNNRKQFLSEETLHKLSLAGLKSVLAQSKNRRSKNEIYFYELCKEYFNDVLHNEPLFNGWDADIIINDIKFAVLWNGKWHYEKIKEGHSVEQVQNRDKIKIDNIKKCSYNPYVIKDMGKYNKCFVEKQFKIFINFLKNNNYIAD